MVLRSLSLGLVFVIAAGLYAAQTTAPPVLTLSGSSIVVSSITPRGSVFAYGFAREPRGWWVQLVQRATQLVDTTGTGQVQWTIDKPVPLRSTWFAVDMTSGLYAVANPAGHRTTEVTLDSKHLKSDVGNEVTQLSFPGSSVQFVVVRPGVGGWAAMVLAGSSLDESKQQGWVSLSTANLQPIGGTTDPVPKKLKKGDVVFILNSWRATYGITAVKE